MLSLLGPLLIDRLIFFFFGKIFASNLSYIVVKSFYVITIVLFIL